MKYTLMNLAILLMVLFMTSCEKDNRNDHVGDLSPVGNKDMQHFLELEVEEEAYYDESAEVELSSFAPNSQEPPSPPVPAPQETTDTINPMIIKNGSMTIEVSDLATGKSKLDSILVKYNGHYQSENYNKGYNQSLYSLVLRIPVKEWDNMLTGMSDGIGIVKDKSVNATDVTEEYTDLTLRLENNEAYLKRYLKLLDKADSIKDMITIQEKVRHIEEEIESKKGRMKYLKNKVSYSMLSLQLVAYHPVLASADDRHFGHEIASAFINGYNGLLGFVLILAGMWPFLLIVGGCVWFGKRFWGRKIAGRKEVVA